jgi:4'-phosphopantetheinyl transferase
MRLTSLHCEQKPVPPWEENRVPHLQGQEVHLWRIDVDQSDYILNHLEELISPEEQLRANKFFHLPDRLRFVLGRGGLKQLLSLYSNIPSSNIRLKIGTHGKPFVQAPDQIHFNISHSGNWVLIAIGSKELGIDLEKITGEFITDSLLEQCFHRHELKLIRESEDPKVEFFKFWTRKEAFLKATGNGIVDDLQAITCMEGSQQWEFPSLSLEKNWHIKSFIMDPSYAVSLCSTIQNPIIRFFNF